jgi:hypothetical protein
VIRLSPGSQGILIGLKFRKFLTIYSEHHMPYSSDDRSFSSSSWKEYSDSASLRGITR